MKIIVFIALLIPGISVGQIIKSEGNIKAIYSEEKRFGTLISQGDVKAGYDEKNKTGALYSKGNIKAIYNENSKRITIFDDDTMIFLFPDGEKDDDGNDKSGLWKTIDNGKTWIKLD